MKAIKKKYSQPAAEAIGTLIAVCLVSRRSDKNRERDRHGLYDVFNHRGKHSLGVVHLCHRAVDLARLTPARDDGRLRTRRSDPVSACVEDREPETSLMWFGETTSRPCVIGLTLDNPMAT